MRFNVLSAALAVAGLGSATALSQMDKLMVMQQLRTTVLDYHWAVTHWEAGCEDNTCSYGFDISGAANATSHPAHPAFKGHCAGSGEGENYRACTLQGEETGSLIVAAKLLPNPSNSTVDSVHHKATIQVSLKYPYPQDISLTLNYTGHASSLYNKDVGTPPQHFTITPDTIAAA